MKTHLSLRKICLVLLTFIPGITTSVIDAQDSIPNPSFEEWETISLPAPFNPYTEPVGWGTLNGVAEGVTKTTDAKDGQFAARIASKKMNLGKFGTFITANLMSGDYSSVLEGKTNEPEFGFPYTKQPFALTFWYKYFPVENDTASIYVELNTKRGIYGRYSARGVLKVTKTVNDWTKGIVEISYDDFPPYENPDTCVIDITSSLSGITRNGDPGFGASEEGSVLYIDGLSFEMDEPQDYGFEKDGIYYRITSSSEKTVAVNGVYGLVDINIPQSVNYNQVDYTVTSVDDECFSEFADTPDSIIHSVIFPPSIKTMGKRVFGSCVALRFVGLPSSLTTISQEMFYACHNLAEITIPESITSIGDGAFAECTHLSSINIPNKLTSIGQYAFVGCQSLSTISLPSSITTLGQYAFSGCANLNSIYAYSQVPLNLTNSAGIFSGVNTGTCTLYVTNDDAKKLYAQADVWKDFIKMQSIIPSKVNSTSTGKLTVIIKDGRLQITGLTQTEQLAIYTAQGIRMYLGTTADQVIYQKSFLKHSVYLIKIGEQSFKISY